MARSILGCTKIAMSGEATVLAIGPCDVDSRATRPGMSIVTGTIRHRNATVWDLTFDGRTEETLGVTANHPLCCETVFNLEFHQSHAYQLSGLEAWAYWEFRKGCGRMP